MDTYQVTALKMGTLYGEKSSMTMGVDFGKPVIIPIWAAAIEGNGKKIVVDTGIRSVEWTKKYLGDKYQVYQEEDETIKNALHHIGWEVEEVDMVINSHLHYDHVGGNHLFKNAIFYLQRCEWDYSFQPVKNQECFYYEELYGYKAVRYTNWKFLNGESEILPGLKVIHFGGHTKGSQGVFVNTKEGVLCIAADAVGVYENLTDKVLPNIMCDVESGFKTIDCITGRADFVLPGHDGIIRKYQSSNFPRVRQTGM